jgi:hypothetical protein
MDDLLKTALVGTAKQPGSQFTAQEADLLLQNRRPDTPEQDLLLRAGLLFLYHQSGLTARSGISSLPPAPPDPNPLRSPRLIQILRQCLTPEAKPLLVEFLHALQAAQLTFPHELLPSALELTDPQVRECLLPVLGQRGRWLSQFNPPWSWVAEGAAALSDAGRTALRRVWEEGTLPQRLAALSALRAAAPAEGRSWLEQSLTQEKVDVRARLVTVLETNLSLEDEPFLESLLDERSDQVRQTAAHLLRQLPESQFSARMRQRGIGLLHSETTGILRHKRLLRCTPPEEIGSDWLRDGIPAKIPHARGKRGYWAEQVMACVPLTFWTKHFATQPDELLAALEPDPHAWEVIHGWTLALIHIPGSAAEKPSWAAPLWGYWTQRLPKSRTADLLAGVERLTAILRSVSPDQAESFVAPFLQLDAQSALLLPLLVLALPQPWSDSFAQRYLDQSRQVAKAAVVDQAYEWTKSLTCAALALPPSSFAAALAPWDLQRPGAVTWNSSAIQQQVERFMDLLRLRAGFYAELAAERVR